MVNIVNQILDVLADSNNCKDGGEGSSNFMEFHQGECAANSATQFSFPLFFNTVDLSMVNREYSPSSSFTLWMYKPNMKFLMLPFEPRAEGESGKDKLKLFFCGMLSVEYVQ